MFEPGGESVRCENLHESLLSPCMFEPEANQSAAKQLHEPLLSPSTFESIRFASKAPLLLQEGHF